MHNPIDRRAFLTALGLGTGAVVVSCADKATTTDASGSGKRRDAATPDDPTDAATSTTAAVVETPQSPLTSDPFVLGVASGDPTPTSVILWTRLITELTAPVDVKWEVAADRSFSRPVASGIVTAAPEWAHSLHLDATGLDPDTEYWYRFSSAAFTSAIGRARTTPEPDASPKQLRLGFASCQDYTEGYYAAHRALAADELDLVFFLGDYIYEYPSTPTSVRQVSDGILTTLDEYRRRYETYTRDADLRASRASCPWVVTWDDHEVENNYADLADNGDMEDAEFATRRAAAYQAYYEHMPMRLDPPSGPDWRIYRSVRFGDLAEFFVLDGRQYRSDQACNSRLDAIVSRASCDGMDADERTMLGPEQERWLADGLSDSDARWKVIAQQTVMSSLVLGDLILNVDQWDGYPAARRRLLEFIRDHEIGDVVVLTGDIHSAGAGSLAIETGNGERLPVAVEFVGTSITSSSLVDLVPGGAELVTPENFPGIAYLNVKLHGYGRCTVTPSEWRTEFVVVDDVRNPDAPPRVDATCVTPAGTPSVTRV